MKKKKNSSNFQALFQFHHPWSNGPLVQRQAPNPHPQHGSWNRRAKRSREREGELTGRCRSSCPSRGRAAGIRRGRRRSGRWAPRMAGHRQPGGPARPPPRSASRSSALVNRSVCLGLRSLTSTSEWGLRLLDASKGGSRVYSKKGNPLGVRGRNRGRRTRAHLTWGVRNRVVGWVMLDDQAHVRACFEHSSG